MKLVASIARGRRWLDELIADPTANTESIAGREGCSVRKVNMTISLAFLAPDLVKAAIDGRFPHGMGVAPPLRPSGRMVSSAPDAWAGRAVTFQSNRASELSNGPRSGSCYTARMSLVATLAMLMLSDASRSGIHTGGEECAMSAWLHSEWRLLHAYVPACSGPTRASLSGKRDFKTRDEGTETASLI